MEKILRVDADLLGALQECNLITDLQRSQVEVTFLLFVSYNRMTKDNLQLLCILHTKYSLNREHLPVYK